MNISAKTPTTVYTDFLDWLYLNGYSFTGITHIPKLRKVFSINDLPNLQISRLHNIKDSDLYMFKSGNPGNVETKLVNMVKMLENFGVDPKSIESDGFVSNSSEYRKDEVLPFNQFRGVQSQEKMEKTEPSKKIENPFKQAICVLGGSGAGKSTTIENILEAEGHEFEMIIPSASTTGLLSQFSPSKSGYVPSKLGKMILKAYDNPTELFTAVFDECHKSNVIEMINDELLQAISTKRNAGKRFISLDDDTAELYPGTETHRGNILMPDNLGFIFISSKPDVILHNDDFFNRIDIVLLKSYEEERLSTIDQLLGKVLSNAEKDSLKSNNE